MLQPRIILTVGSCLLLSRAEAIELRAEANTPEGLERPRRHRIPPGAVRPARRHRCSLAKDKVKEATAPPKGGRRSGPGPRPCRMPDRIEGRLPSASFSDTRRLRNAGVWGRVGQQQRGAYPLSTDDAWAIITISRPFSTACQRADAAFAWLKPGRLSARDMHVVLPSWWLSRIDVLVSMRVQACEVRRRGRPHRDLGCFPAFLWGAVRR